MSVNKLYHTTGQFRSDVSILDPHHPDKLVFQPELRDFDAASVFFISFFNIWPILTKLRMDRTQLVAKVI
jgi:hypothetical protein